MPAETVQMDTPPASELDQPIWSVISFERVADSGIDHAAAIKLMSDLEDQGVPGLCTVTVDAAARIKTRG